VRAIELRAIVEAYPQRALYGDELTGGGQLVEFPVDGARQRPGGGRAAS
jgi:hypothetical protein